MVPRDLLGCGRHSRIILCSVPSASGEERPLVLKATRLAGVDDEDGKHAERVLREVQLCARDFGPFVVASHGWLSAPPEAHLLLDFLPGGDLDLLIDRNGPLGAESTRFYAGCAALGLEALHAQGVAHRDIKPENLCIDAAGYARVADLGFARTLPADGRAHTLLGTPEYLSPEVFLGEGHGTPSDLWALGATIYTLLLAAHPYGGATPDEVYASALDRQRVGSGRLRNGTAPELTPRKAFAMGRLRSSSRLALPEGCLWAWAALHTPEQPPGHWACSRRLRGGLHSERRLRLACTTQEGPPFFPQRVMPDTARALITALLARDAAARPAAAGVWAFAFFEAGAVPGWEERARPER